MPIVLKYGSLNLLEPSGSVKVCNRIALPFYIDGRYERLKKAEISVRTTRIYQADKPSFKLGIS
jgi:hypothetical protein